MLCVETAPATAILLRFACVAKAPAFFFDQVSHDIELEFFAGHNAAQLRVFGFKLLKPNEIARLKAGILIAPCSNRIRVDADAPRDSRRRRARVELFEHANDLGFGEFRLLQGEVS